jgi:tetratricopeptide (TPR) repeat protein
MAIEEPLARVVAGDWDRAAAIAEFKQQQRLQEIQMELTRVVRDQNWDKALELLDEAQAAMGPSAGLTQYRIGVLQMAGRTDEVAALQAELVQQSWDDPMMLNEIAWGIAIGEGERDLDLALKTAERAAELTSHEDASILDTLARVYYEQGKLAEAVEWQKKAVGLDAGNEQLTAALQMYEAELAEPASPDTPPAEEPEPAPEESATPPSVEASTETP